MGHLALGWLVRDRINRSSHRHTLQEEGSGWGLACGIYFGYYRPLNLSLWPAVVTQSHSAFAHFWENLIVLCVSDPESSSCGFLLHPPASMRGSGICRLENQVI